LYDFEELHSEANTLSIINNRLKGLNNWLENKINQLESELDNLKVDFENMEMIYRNSTCCERQLAANPCEDYIVLKNQVKYLLKTCAKFIRRKANSKVVIGYQNCVFGKVGLGYNSFHEKKVKKFVSFFSTNEPNDMPLISCNYYMKKGHVYKNCNARKYEVPKEFMKWIPKGPTKV